MSITVYSREEEVPQGIFLADCAVSGGSLSAYLQSAQQASGEKLCVVLSPIYMDFPLPCLSGVGTALNAEELKNLRGNAPCYFSDTLCTEYFTYLRDGTAHAVLFDTMKSLQAKKQAIEDSGIQMVVVPDANLRKQLFG